MNVTNPELVIITVINSDNLKVNSDQLFIKFKGLKNAIPTEDSNYVGFYFEAPVLQISHIGIVESIHRYPTDFYNGVANFHLKSIIKLSKSKVSNHPIRNHEKWSLKDLGLNANSMNNFRNAVTSI